MNRSTGGASSDGTVCFIEDISNEKLELKREEEVYQTLALAVFEEIPYAR
jgi:hypothetical protein